MVQHTPAWTPVWLGPPNSASSPKHTQRMVSWHKKWSYMRRPQTEFTPHLGLTVKLAVSGGAFKVQFIIEDEPCFTQARTVRVLKRTVLANARARGRPYEMEKWFDWWLLSIALHWIAIMCSDLQPRWMSSHKGNKLFGRVGDWRCPVDICDNPPAILHQSGFYMIQGGTE